MIEVVCVWVGDKYSEEYVINLRNAVAKYLQVPYRFNCVTDRIAWDTPGIRYIASPGNLSGWWVKPFIFSTMCPVKGQVLYLDIDQIIIGDLNKFTQVSKLTMLRDFATRINPAFFMGNSSVMAFEKSEYTWLWSKFCEEETENFKHGDQEFITLYGQPDFYPDEWVRSWKWEVFRGGIASFFSTGEPLYLDTIPDLSQTSIISFHGSPKPHEITEFKELWTGEYNDGLSEKASTLSFIGR